MTSLFLDKPKDFEKRVERLLGHFRHAEVWFFEHSKKGQPTPRDLLWVLFQDAMRTSRLIPDQERRTVGRIGSVMPSTRVTIDQDFEIRRSRLSDGMDEYDSTTVREVPHQSAIDRMVDTKDLLRFIAAGPKGRDVQRYKRTFLAYANGASLEQCSRVWDPYRVDVMSRQSLNDVKQRVLGQILKGIEQQFGLVKTSRSFRRATLKEIDQARRARKREEARRKREEAENNGA